jgi:methionyl-tRNA formyltransferase
MTPWPGARTSYVEKKGHKELVLLEVSEVELEELDPAAQMLASRGAAGTVLEAGKRLVVMAADAPLIIEQLKPAGKQAMEGAAFLRGARLEAGTRLGGH